VCGRTSESTIIGLIIPESATGIVTTFDICRFQGATALALTTLWKPWVFAINKQLHGNRQTVTSMVNARRLGLRNSVVGPRQF
jgi:hypothetical protein